MRGIISVSLVLCLTVGVARSEVRQIKTHFDDDADVYVTTGYLELEVPLDELAVAAADFHGYAKWALNDINRNASGDPYITLIRGVEFKTGRPLGMGHFAVRFDVDLIWPFGSKNEVIRFGVMHLKERADGPGIERLTYDLFEDSSVLKTFHLDLHAVGDGQRSRVNFKARVKLSSLLDTFFSMSAYKKNIEYRIVKILKNLRDYTAEERRLREKKPTGSVVTAVSPTAAEPAQTGAATTEKDGLTD